jgi:hypothetical protein
LAKKSREPERGSIAIQIAVLMIVIIGMVGLGVEVTFLLFKQRQMQSAADSAALGGATALAVGYPAVAVEAQAISASLGFINGSNGARVVVNNPPSSGPHAGDANYVEVIVSQPQTLSLIGLFVSRVINVGARTVAFKGAPAGNACVLSLATGNVSGAISASGGAIATMSGCSLAAHSTSNTSISASGGSTISAQAAVTAGNYTTSGGGQIMLTDPPIQTYSTNVPSDPYSGFTAPAPGSCLKTGYSLAGGKSAALSYGTYCNGISVSGGSHLTLNPGVYIINNGNLTVTGNSTLTATGGVSIVLTGSSSSNVGTINFSGGSNVDIVAPSSGSMAGIALFQDPKAPVNNAISLVGGANQLIEGAIYLPKARMTYTGGSTTGATCTELLAWTMVFTGGSYFQLNCPGFPILPIGSSASSPQLAE